MFSEDFLVNVLPINLYPSALHCCMHVCLFLSSCLALHVERMYQLRLRRTERESNKKNKLEWYVLKTNTDRIKGDARSSRHQKGKKLEAEVFKCHD